MTPGTRARVELILGVWSILEMCYSVWSAICDISKYFVNPKRDFLAFPSILSHLEHPVDGCNTPMHWLLNLNSIVSTIHHDTRTVFDLTKSARKPLAEPPANTLPPRKQRILVPEAFVPLHHPAQEHESKVAFLRVPSLRQLPPFRCIGKTLFFSKSFVL